MAATAALREEKERAGRSHGSCSMTAAGWDPHYVHAAKLGPVSLHETLWHRLVGNIRLLQPPDLARWRRMGIRRAFRSLARLYLTPTCMATKRHTWRPWTMTNLLKINWTYCE